MQPMQLMQLVQPSSAHLSLQVVEEHMLKEDDGVVTADGLHIAEPKVPRTTSFFLQ